MFLFYSCFFFFFNDTATTEIYTLSLHDALPIYRLERVRDGGRTATARSRGDRRDVRSEEHTSELQSRSDLVCRLLLDKKKKLSNQALDKKDYNELLKQTNENRFTALVFVVALDRHGIAVGDRLVSFCFFFLMIRRPPRSTLFPYTTLSDLIYTLSLHDALPIEKPTPARTTVRIPTA